MDRTARQQEYYARTARSYDDQHIRAGDEHFVALEYIRGLATVVNARSILDVGSGTGRGVRFLGNSSDLRVVGVEPIDELRAQADGFGGEYHRGSADQLPFADNAFDIIIATALMHHLPEPSRALREMMRVAAKGIMISDANRFGQGSITSRLAKTILCRTGLWPYIEFIRTGGRGFHESEGDGVFYSYSVYDSLKTLAQWGDRTFIVPTGYAGDGWLQGLVTSPYGLLVSLREPRTGWAGA